MWKVKSGGQRVATAGLNAALLSVGKSAEDAPPVPQLHIPLRYRGGRREPIVLTPKACLIVKCDCSGTLPAAQSPHIPFAVLPHHAAAAMSGAGQDAALQCGLRRPPTSQCWPLSSLGVLNVAFRPGKWLEASCVHGREEATIPGCTTSTVPGRMVEVSPDDITIVSLYSVLSSISISWIAGFCVFSDSTRGILETGTTKIPR